MTCSDDKDSGDGRRRRGGAQLDLKPPKTVLNFKQQERPGPSSDQRPVSSSDQYRRHVTAAILLQNTPTMLLDRIQRNRPRRLFFHGQVGCGDSNSERSAMATATTPAMRYCPWRFSRLMRNAGANRLPSDFSNRARHRRQTAEPRDVSRGSPPFLLSPSSPVRPDFLQSDRSAISTKAEPKLFSDLISLSQRIVWPSEIRRSPSARSRKYYLNLEI